MPKFLHAILCISQVKYKNESITIFFITTQDFWEVFTSYVFGKGNKIPPTEKSSDIKLQ